MNLVLPEPSAAALRDRGIEVIHLAYGLAVPAIVNLPLEGT